MDPDTWTRGYYGQLESWILRYFNFFSIRITDSQNRLDIQVFGYPSIRIPNLQYGPTVQKAEYFVRLGDLSDAVNGNAQLARITYHIAKTTDYRYPMKVFCFVSNIPNTLADWPNNL